MVAWVPEADEERTRVRRALEWKRMGEESAQVAHTWCTVVREVRFLSTSLQFYRSGRVSVRLYTYIQGDPRNTRFSSSHDPIAPRGTLFQCNRTLHCLEFISFYTFCTLQFKSSTLITKMFIFIDSILHLFLFNCIVDSYGVSVLRLENA